MKVELRMHMLFCLPRNLNYLNYIANIGSVGLLINNIFVCIVSPASFDGNRETVELTGAADPVSGAKESIVYAMAGKTAQE